MNIAVFASGRGTNFSAIARAIKKGKLTAHLALLVCDTPQAPVIAKAKRAGVEVALVERKDFPTKEDFENKIVQHLEVARVELVCLAGFMRMLSPSFVGRYKNKIINIHPALLPSFKGSGAIKDAFEYGAKVTGVTVHFVDEEMDHGPIIAQAPVKIEEADTLETLEAKIHTVEHKLYPLAIQLIVEGKVVPEGRRVRIITR